MWQQGEPPFETYAAGVWRSPKGEVTKPPTAAARPWRIMVLQEAPRPKKNPRWKVISVDERGELEMPAGSRYRCLYNPVSYRPTPDDRMEHVEQWRLVREVRCSSDGFRTYTPRPYAVSYGPDGKVLAKTGEQAELYLVDTASSGTLRATILLRSE